MSILTFVLKVILFIIIFPNCFIVTLLCKLHFDAWLLTGEPLSYLLTGNFININKLEKDEQEVLVRDFCYVEKRNYYPLGIEIREITNTKETNLPHKCYVLLIVDEFDDLVYVY